MDILDSPALREKCLETYGYLESSDFTHTALWSTVALPFLAIGLECVAYWRITCDSKKEKKDDEEAAGPAADSLESSAIPLTETVTEQPQPQAEPQAQPQPAADIDSSKDPEAKPEEKKSDPSNDTCCVDSASPHVRANRLVVATFLYGLALTAFILRTREITTKPTISVLCRDAIHPSPPNWAVFVIFVLMPFMCGSVAFLRMLVDCALVRWDTGLRYHDDTKDGRCMWLPCMPFVVVAVVLWLLLEAFKVPIACLMGNWDVSMWTQLENERRKKKGKGRADDVEMQGEEGQGLVDNVDGPAEVEDEGEAREEPPAYDEVVSARVSVEGKRAVDV